MNNDIWSQFLRRFSANLAVRITDGMTPLLNGAMLYLQDLKVYCPEAFDESGSLRPDWQQIVRTKLSEIQAPQDADLPLRAHQSQVVRQRQLTLKHIRARGPANTRTAGVPRLPRIPVSAGPPAPVCTMRDWLITHQQVRLPLIRLKIDAQHAVLCQYPHFTVAQHVVHAPAGLPTRDCDILRHRLSRQNSAP